MTKNYDKDLANHKRIVALAQATVRKDQGSVKVLARPHGRATEQTEALEKSKLRLSRVAAQHHISESSFEFTSANLEVSRLKPIWRFLNGEYFGVTKFKGKIEGLPDYSVDLWAKDYSEFLHKTLRGKSLPPQDIRRLHKEFSHGETEIILDMNRATRFVLKKLVAEDFKDPRQFRHFLEGNHSDYLKVDAGSLS